MSLSSSQQPFSHSDPWERLISMSQDRIPLKITISGFNSGGCTGFYESLRCFVPKSQLLDSPESTSELMGQTLEVVPIEVARENGRIVLSEKKALQYKHLASLEVGESVSGQISKIEQYGFRVNLGHNVSGLLHNKSLPASPPSLNVGDDVDVLIESKLGERISLVLSNNFAVSPEKALADGCLSIGNQIFLDREILPSSVMLPGPEFALLHYLWQHRGETVTYPSIIQDLGDANGNGNMEAIRNNVYALRRNEYLKERITTHRGVGYRLI